MRTLFIALLFVATTVEAALPPIVRNAYTTNTVPPASAVTNSLGLTGSTATFVRSDGNQTNTLNASIVGTNFTATGTGADQLPVGTTAQEPANAAGLIRWNSTTGRMEVNIGSGWVNEVRLSGDTMTGPLVNQITNTGANLTPEIIISNATPATSGISNQYSPAFIWSGNTWLSTSASNAPVVFRSYVTTASGATAPTGSWIVDSSMNGAAFTGALTLSSAGGLSLGQGLSISASGNMAWSGRSFLASSVSGAIEAKNTAGSAISTIQFNIPQITKTANYTAVVLDSGLRFVNIGAIATNTITLPTAAQGLHFYGYIDAAQNCQFQAVGSDKIQDGATLGAAAGDVHSSTVGSTIHFFSPKATLWVVDQKSGVWVLD